ncbi:exportin-2-like [Plakobranchus ocellatus]|uniref:Exportin-2 n=1 Tax=Plakobranchus ocellatus TaxID=259542 RepID=A0AAV4A935_9GAST|nr:exportin-2-like [Plakobranchus ocellatus]
MEVTPANLEAMAGYLQQTLSPDQDIRRNAEKFLESVEGNKHYPVLLLHLMDKDAADAHIRVSAAITFKNYVKRNWRVDDVALDKIHADDREQIKQYIVGLMLKSPEQVQKQLSDAISIIGREDFPKKWPGLLTEMISKFQSGDFNVINGVLRTAHSIFKRYRHEFKSQELWEEIKFVLENFASTLTELFKATMGLATTHANDPKALKVIFSSILLICKIFYSLNFQDLPEHFEDNMDVWMEHFLHLLRADNKLLQTDDDEAGLLEQVKSQICDNVGLYAQKYDEEFSTHLPNFVKAIWELLVTTGPSVKYDLLVSNAIQFLASVAERPNYKSLFDGTETLANICEKVVVPNMQLREADEELFEDNPEEYMRRDIEGSDVDTRRRAACDLVQALSKSHEGPVIQNFSRYVQALLEEYAKNPGQNWRSKDTAIFLVTSLAAKGQTQKQGVTQTSELVNITEFFQSHILPDIQATNVNEIPILKADVLKYLMVFRNQLPVPVIQNTLTHLLRFVQADPVVVHTYAASCLERLFMVRQAGVPAITCDLVLPMASDLMTSLFAAMEKPGSTENEYIMKAVMRTMSLLQEHILPMMPQLIAGLKEKLVLVSKNPSKPHFNHYLFECLCVAVRSACKKHPEAVTAFEEALFQPFTEILQQDVQEFIPYVFQILSLLMEQHSGDIPTTYLALFPHLLAPVLWERPGNIPPLVRLIQAYIQKGSHQIEAEKLNGLLGVFQKLIASKTHDHEGFYLLNYIIEFVPKESLSQYLKQIFVLLFQRLSHSKTTKFIKSLLVFFSLYAIKYSASSLIETIDGIQPKMFAMVVERLFLPDLQKVSGHTSKKICAVGVTKILTEAEAMVNTEYSSLWARLLQALVGLFELPEDDSVPDDEHFIEIEDTPGYQTSYSQLAFAGRQDHDPLAGFSEDPKVCLAKGLEKMAIRCPGRIQPMITSGMEAQAQTFLLRYCQAANVSLG